MKKNFKRRDFLKKAGIGGAAATAVSSFPAPAIAAERIEVNCVATWGRGYPGLGTGAEAVSQRISDLSDGRIVVNHFAGGERVGPLDVFTEVTSGNAQMYNSADYYWVGQHPGWGFFAAVPFGMIATEINGWIRHGGGQELWDELGDEFGLKNFMAGNSGVQMGGWFNKEINSPDDFKGLKMRIPGLGGMMMSKLGLSVVGVPGGQIYENLINGTIDATEWVGPWNDERSRFYEAAKYYYWPGCHEPGTLITLGCNKSWLTSLSKTDQMIIEHASTVQNERMLTEYNANNGAALQRLVNDHGVELREFNEDVIDAMGEAAEQLYEELAEGNELTGRILASFRKSRNEISGWLEKADSAFFTQRNRVLEG